MRIILTSLTLAKQYPNAIIRSMVMKPLAGVKNVQLLAPTEAMVKGHKHWTGDQRFASWPKVSTDAYTTAYRDILNKNMSDLKTWYSKLYPNNEQVLLLCCYCPPEKFCHRQRVAKFLRYLNQEMGLTHIIELDAEEGAHS